jgi:hypothetical protein
MTHVRMLTATVSGLTRESQDVTYLDLSQPRRFESGVLKAIKSTQELVHLQSSWPQAQIRWAYALALKAFMKSLH